MDAIERKARNNQIVKEYHQGKTTNDLANEYLLTRTRIYAILRYSDCCAVNKKKQDSKAAKRNELIRKEYVSGSSISKLSDKYNLSQAILYDIIKPTTELSIKTLELLDRRREIYELFTQGVPRKEIAQKYGLSRQRIEQIYAAQKAVN